MNVRFATSLTIATAVFIAGSFAGFSSLWADDIVTLDGQTYENVKDILPKRNGLYFVAGSGSDLHGVTVPYAKLSDETKEKYHCDPYEFAFALARQNARVNLTKSLAFSLDQLDEAKKKAQAEHKLIGFIMEWDSFFIPSRPMGPGSNDALAQFYDVFKDNIVLVFVRHEAELDKVPDAVKSGFFGPEEGGFAPNMAVVSADCSQFVCEIPYGGKDSDGMIREKIFREKIAVMKRFEHAAAAAATK